jgi:hypothetical protein
MAVSGASVFQIQFKKEKTIQSLQTTRNCRTTILILKCGIRWIRGKSGSFGIQTETVNERQIWYQYLMQYRYNAGTDRIHIKISTCRN